MISDREELTHVEISDVREGERVQIVYTSQQSSNKVEHEGVVQSAQRYGQETKRFVLLGDNDIEYKCEKWEEVYSTGENQRQLSSDRPDVYLVEGLDDEEWEREERHGALHIRFQKNEVFRCPQCREKQASIATENSNGTVTVSCGSCRSTTVCDEQPLEVSLKITR